ncbi:MAG: hypothetical protein AB8C13_10610 [Phycisphaerales bacterium]
MNCGCNTKSGKSIRTKSKKAKSSSSGLKIAAKAGSFTLSPILPIIGAAIGGVIGATIWLLIQVFTGYEIGLLAAAVGALCGIGAALFSHGGSTWAGIVAVVTALVSVFLGKILIATLFIVGGDALREQIESEITQPITVETIHQDLVFEYLVMDIAQSRIDQNIPIEWTNEETLETAYWPFDYPQDLVDETREQWDAMPLEQQIEYKQELLISINQDFIAYNEELETELDELNSFQLSDLFSYWDVLWAFLAIGAAWQCGNGEE